jgi:hypothetical protein
VSSVGTRARRCSRIQGAAQPDEQGLTVASRKQQVDRGWRETDLPCWPRPASNHAPTRIHHLPPPLTLATAASVVQGIRATRAYRLRFGQVQVVHRQPRCVIPCCGSRSGRTRHASAGRRGIYSTVVKKLPILPWTAGSPFPAFGISLGELCSYEWPQTVKRHGGVG